VNRIRRPRYADVAATLALVLALGGTTAYAADRVHLPKHTVGKSQLKRQAVDSSRIKNGTIKQKDLAAASVGAAQLQDRSVANSKLQDGSVGNRELAGGSVGTGKLQDGAVTAGKLARNAVSLDDIAGVDVVSTITVSALAAGTCSTVSIPVPGALPGQLAAMSVTGGADPRTVVFGPLRVTQGAVTTTACNVGVDPVTAQLPVRVGTFG
jgi:trimeric autotransporter adhesin